MAIQPNPLLEAYVFEQMEEFLYFIGEDTLPRPTIEWIEPQPMVKASHNYSPKLDRHLLYLNPEMPMDVAHTSMLFHEFIHLYDAETLMKKNDNYYKSRGYLEYHAGQIDLLYLIGAETIHDVPTFSIFEEIETVYGTKRIVDYLLYDRNNLSHMLKTFLSLQDYSTKVGIVFNVIGRISICRMYATDFEDRQAYFNDLKNIVALLGPDFERCLSYCEGWATDFDGFFGAFGALFEKFAIQNRYV